MVALVPDQTIFVKVIVAPFTSLAILIRTQFNPPSN